jgi:hypothetical protein
MGGIEAVDPGYRRLYERAVEVLGADERILSVDLSGSIGAGTADEWSDLDLAVVTRPDDHQAVLDEWPQWLARITPTVFARTPLAPFIINTVTDEGLTFDLAVWRGEAPTGPFDPTEYTAGLMSSTRFAEVGSALEYAVAEQLRGMAGPFISLIQREEHLRHLTGVAHLVGLLTTVFVAETGAPPPGKHWNRTFTEEQRAAAGALPPVSATREGLIEFGLALNELLLTRARPLYPRYGLEWPSALAATAADRVHDVLGIDISAWCH